MPYTDDIQFGILIGKIPNFSVMYGFRLGFLCRVFFHSFLIMEGHRECSTCRNCICVCQYCGSFLATNQKAPAGGSKKAHYV